MQNVFSLPLSRDNFFLLHGVRANTYSNATHESFLMITGNVSINIHSQMHHFFFHPFIHFIPYSKTCVFP